MSDQTTSAATALVRRYLERTIEQLRTGRDERPVANRLLEVGMRGLIAFGEQLDRDIQEREAAEIASVYLAVAQRMASHAGLTEEQAFAGLVRLCEGDAASPLSPDEAHASERLRRHLVTVSVTYRAEPGHEAEREVVVLHDPDTHGVKMITVRSPLRWEELPTEVRRQVLQDNQPTVTYQLFPTA